MGEIGDLEFEIHKNQKNIKYMLKDMSKYKFQGKSQLVWLEGKKCTNSTFCIGDRDIVQPRRMINLHQDIYVDSAQQERVEEDYLLVKTV